MVDEVVITVPYGTAKKNPHLQGLQAILPPVLLKKSTGQ